MEIIHSSQITIIAISVENYEYLGRLHSPHHDIDNLQKLFLDQSTTGLFTDKQFLSIANPKSDTLREVITDYVYARSTPGDILIFYFSGHGVPIGNNDFGFCTTETKYHDVAKRILPLTVFKMSDLLESLSIMNVIPIIFIDACYSGVAGKNLYISSGDTINKMKSEIIKQNASSYALYCSCSEEELSTGNNNGGLFTQLLISVLSNGIKTKNNEQSYIYLQDIHQEIISQSRLSLEVTPQLYIGESLPKIPLSKNVKFIPQIYKFSPYFAKIVIELWNNGNEREFSNEDFLKFIGRGAYANHRKLSIKAWDLIEDNPVSGKRKLTSKGKRFAKGEITIPDTIVYDSKSEDFIASPKSIQLHISMF